MLATDTEWHTQLFGNLAAFLHSLRNAVEAEGQKTPAQIHLAKRLHQRTNSLVQILFRNCTPEARVALVGELTAMVRKNELVSACELFSCLHHLIVSLELGDASCVHHFRECFDLLSGSVSAHLDHRNYLAFSLTLGPLRTVVHFFCHSRSALKSPALADEVSFVVLERVYQAFCEFAHREGLKAVQDQLGAEGLRDLLTTLFGTFLLLQAHWDGRADEGSEEEQVYVEKAYRAFCVFVSLLFKPQTKDNELYFALVAKILHFLPDLEIPRRRNERGEHKKVLDLFAGLVRHVLLSSDPLLIHDVSLRSTIA